MADNQQTVSKSIWITPEGETLNLDYISSVVLGTQYAVPVANTVYLILGNNVGDGTSGSNAILTKTFGTQDEADYYYHAVKEQMKSIGRVTNYEARNPTITSLVANTGPAAGGTLISVNGTNFQNGGKITFDGIPAAFAWIQSPILMKVVTPPHAAGAVDVKYIDRDTAIPVFTFAASFTYV